MNTRVVRFALIAAAASAAVLLTASSCNSSNKAEREQQERGIQELLRTQPVPFFPYSQMRANLAEIERAQAEGLQSTSFMFNQGVPDPMRVCPSIGLPIPNTASLSNPLQEVGGAGAVVEQLEPNGVYTPNSSSGTYVICVNPDGKALPVYWEGFVHTEFGPAKWDSAVKQVVPTGPPSGAFSTQRAK